MTIVNSVDALPNYVLLGAFRNVNSANITLTDVNYSNLLVVFYDLRTTVSGQVFGISFSNDNGSTFLNTCDSQRRSQQWDVAMPGAATVNTGEDRILLSGLSSNGSRSVSGLCYIDSFSTNQPAIVTSHISSSSIATPLNRFFGYSLGYVDKNIPCNCLRFTLTTQNVVGSVLVYGLLKGTP